MSNGEEGDLAVLTDEKDGGMCNDSVNGRPEDALVKEIVREGTTLGLDAVGIVIPEVYRAEEEDEEEEVDDSKAASILTPSNTFTRSDEAITCPDALGVSFNSLFL